MQDGVFCYQHSEIPSETNRLYDALPTSEHLLILSRALDLYPLSLFYVLIVKLVVVIHIHLVQLSFFRQACISRRLRFVIFFKNSIQFYAAN
jgi:hypothetical protein